MNVDLRVRFILPTIGLLALSLGAVSLISYSKSKAALKEALEQQMEAQVASTARYLDDWLGGQRRSLASWAQQSIFVNSTKDSFVGKASRKSANEELGRRLKDYDYFESISLADAQGKVLVSSKEAWIDSLDVKGDPFFQAAQAGEAIVGEAFRSPDSGQAVFPVAAPVRRDDGVFGVLFAYVKVDYLYREFASGLKLGSSGYAFFYAGDGVVLAHPDAAVVWKEDLSRYDFGRQLTDGASGVAESSWLGSENLTSFARIASVGSFVGLTAPRNEIFASLSDIGRVSLLVGLIALGVAIGGALYLVTTIIKPIKLVIHALEESARCVASAIERIAGINHALSEGACAQASSIEETSASLEEIASMTMSNAENSSKTNQIMDQTKGLVLDAKRVMDELTVSMAAVSKAASDTSIIVKTIDEIAFQTNILALNAAVEAARAGEAGAGFAIVADEVRSLAMRAAKAARSTGDLIEVTVSKVEVGTRLANQASKSLGLVSDKSVEVAGLIEEISGSSSEQSNGVQLVSKAMSQMDSVVQQTTRNADESAVAVDEVSQQAQALQRIADELVGIVESNRKSRPAAASAGPLGREGPGSSKARRSGAHRSSRVEDPADLGWN